MHLPKLVTSADLAKLAAPGETKMVRVILRRIVHTGPHRVSGVKRKYLFERNPAVGAHVLDVPESLWMHGAPLKTYVDNLSISHDLQGNRIPTKAPLVIQILDWPGAAKQPLADADFMLAIESLIIRLANSQDSSKFQTLSNDWTRQLASLSICSVLDPLLEKSGSPQLREFIAKFWPNNGQVVAPGAKEPSADPHAAMQRLAEYLGAPPVIMSALEILESNLPADEKEAALNDTLETLKQQEAATGIPTTASAPETAPPAESSHSASPPSAKPAPASNAERQRAYRAKKKAEREAAKLQTA